MQRAWPEPVQRVASFRWEARAEARIEQLEESAATAKAAATAVGCTLDQIVKSLVLVCDGEPLLVLIPGDRRGDMDKVAQLVGAAAVRTAGADEVIAATGFAPGGVAPFPLPGVRRVLVERTLLSSPVVWVGAGSEQHLAALSPLELVRLTHGDPVDIVRVPA